MPFGKWADFNSCVLDIMKSQGKDEKSAKRICGALQARLGKESFSWAGDIQPHQKNLIRGKAIHPISTVHPEEWPNIRVYLEDELQKAAHSLVGQPLLLDHMFPLNGKVIGAQYEDGVVEYVAELNDNQILDWIKGGTITHCSVEYDWSSLVKVNGVAPKGLQFTGLALLKNFEPGDPQSSVEVWEGIVARLKEAKLKEQGEPQEFIYHELRDPAVFLEDRFSTVWIDKINGIQGIYGRLRDNTETPQPMALLFMRANGWGLEQIKTWLQDHPQYLGSPIQSSAVGVQPASPAPPSRTGLIGEGKMDLKKLTEKVNGILKERVWTRAYINDLPDSAFAIILPGGEKDEQDKTVPRSLRKFPFKNAQGQVDLPHLRNANARLPQSDLSDTQKARAGSVLNKVKQRLGIGVAGEEEMIRKWQEQTGDVPQDQVGDVPEVPETLEVSSEPSLDEVITAVEEALGEINDAIEQINANFQALQPKTVEALQNQITILTDEKKAIQEALKVAEGKISALEKEKTNLTKRLGEAIIDPSAKPAIPEGCVSKEEVLRELKALDYERVPRTWPYGAHLQNSRIKGLIKRLEGESG